MPRKLVLFGLAALTLTLAPVAQAQVSRVDHRDGASDYFFDVDDLAGDGYGNHGDVYIGRRGTARVLLIRPRVEFVSELTKSVEQL